MTHSFIGQQILVPHLGGIPPAADFTADVTSGNFPLSVTFTDTSTGDGISAWLWTFGDGNTSTVQNPTHIYDGPGTYTVSLSVTNPGGADTETKIAYINVTSSMDGIANFASGYSVRQLLTSYSGALVKLRRGSDNAESDFGVETGTGYLDDAAIAAWLGAASGYIKTWYDQSGNNNHQTQTTTGSQPIYVPNAIGGRPAFNFDDTDDFMLSDLSATMATVIAVAAYETWNGVIVGSNQADNRYFFSWASDTNIYCSANEGVVNFIFDGETDWHIFSGQMTNPSDIFLDGLERYLNNNNFSMTPLSGRIYLGRRNNALSANYFDGSMSEIIVLSAINATSRRTIEQSQANYFSLGITNPGVWTWFNDPRALRNGSKTFIGAIDSVGNVQVSEYSHPNRQLGTPVTLHATLEVDDHDNPGLLVRASDSKLIAFYSAHGGATIYQRISTNALDASAWEAETDLDAELGLSVYTYANPIQLTAETNEPIYLFFRASTLGGVPVCYTKSTDDGVSWSAGAAIVANGAERPYFRVAQNGTDRIDFAVNDGHPNEVATNSLYHLYYQGGNFYKTDGTLIGGVGDLPFGPADLTQVYDGTAVRSWVWDIAVDSSGYPVIVYATFPTPASDHRYRYARWNGAGWDDNQICTAGGPLYAAETYYSGGVALDHSDPDIVYASRKPVGATWHTLYKYVTADGGASFVETQMATEKAFRPVVARDHNGEPDLLHIVGLYQSYTNYFTGIKIRNSS